MMKFYGGCLMFIGAFFTFGSSWFILLAILGLLLFLQGMKNVIASLLVECIRSDKSPGASPKGHLSSFQYHAPAGSSFREHDLFRTSVR